MQNTTVNIAIYTLYYKVKYINDNNREITK